MFPAYLRHISALTWKTRRLLNIDIFSVNPVLAVGGGQICPPLHKFLNFLFLLYKHMLRLVDFSCMSVTVLLQKKRASYVPRFNFDGIFFDKKSSFQIANFLFFSNFAKNGDFFKSSQGYIF